MQIETLELENYRNYKSLSLKFSPAINMIYGENGQGKTNILESIYLCSCGKSHKGTKDKELIRFGQEEAHVKAIFNGDLGKDRIDIHLKNGNSKNKGIAINQIPLKRLSELFGKIFVVIFSAEDLDIIKRGPSDRRKFIDVELCQMDPVYTSNLINYNKILNQRRELFKTINDKNSAELLDTLDLWDQQLSFYGSKIVKRRREFLEKLEKLVFDIHYSLTEGKEKIRLQYEPQTEEDYIYEELLKAREKDIYYKQTSVGPHRDDFSFFNGKENLKTYGSNGQQRTCALSLKMAEIKMIELEKREKPILLLDDVLSELDRNRQKALLKSIGDTQTIITSTGIDEFIESELVNTEKFLIKNAELIPQK